MRYLSVDEILRLHFQIIENYGGSHGIRDGNRLRSVVDAPRQNLFGAEQYPTAYEKAAVYMRNIIGDYPFSDGNKRTGITVAGVFLLRNSIRLTTAPRSLEDFAVSVATDHLSVEQIAMWIQENTLMATV